jgi:molybdate transport system substrate-binding protein
MKHRISPWLLVLAFVVSFCVAGHGATINVFAAASLAEALKEIATGYEKATGDKLSFNLAGSNALARQIDEGAPADLFFSADEAQMNNLEKKGRIVRESRTNLLGNSLVIVVLADSGLKIASPKDLDGPAVKRLALADPKGVPAGVYAKEHLTKLGLWPAIELKVVPTENVRGALAAVESGNIEAGIVYKTDAALAKKVSIAHEIPAAEGPAIRYPVALVKDSKQSEAARRFLQHLTSDKARAVFVKFGFITRP